METIKAIHKILLRVAVCICLFLPPHKISAQYLKTVDSLKLIVADTKDERVKLKALVHLNEINQNRNEVTAGYWQQVSLGIKLKDYGSASVAYYGLGYFEYEKNNFIVSEKILLKGMSLAKQTNNDLVCGRICNTMMCIYDKKGDMNTAINYLKQGEQFLIKSNKKVNLTRLYCNASLVYKNYNLKATALEFARKAYSTARSSGELEPVTTASWFLANMLLSNSNNDSAIYYFSQGKRIAEHLALVYTQGDMLKGLSDVYAAKKQYASAKEFLSKAIKMYDSVNVPDRRIACEESLAYLDFINKDFGKVKIYVLGREKMTTEDSLNNKRYVNKWLANIALVENNVEGWKEYQRKYELAENAFTSNEIQKNILELEAQYNLSKKENELLQKEVENRKRLRVIALLGFGLISLTVIAMLQYRNFKNKQKIVLQNSIIEKQNALAVERSRIAADMHDDVGAGLSRIRYITSAMKETKHISEEDMDRILLLSDESVEKMNEIIWSLNQGNQQLAELIYHIRIHCAEMVSNANMEFECIMPDEIPSKTLDWKQTRNIYLLVKEAVNNAVKHSAAKNIVIHFFINNNLHITVKDDGKGFDVSNVRKEGNGLLNYKKRAETLGGNYTITSLPGTGTEISITIPLVASK